MFDKFPITQKGYDKLSAELTRLKTIERPSVINAIAEARAHGDLSENAEYSAAMEKQGFIEAKIADLEDKLARSEVIEINSLKGDKVVFGATVTLADEMTDEQVRYQIVSDVEADIAAGAISIASPVAKALLGKVVGESVEVSTPKGIKYYTILDVQFIG